MESQIEINFFRGGTPVQQEVMVINYTSQHPDITDVGIGEIFQWVSDVISLGKDIYAGFTTGGKAWLDVVKDVGNLVKDVFAGKNQGTNVGDRIILLGPGALPAWPGIEAVDEARVTFRAWSEDDLTTSFGRVDPVGKIIDLEERRYNENHGYERSFSIPLKNAAPGPYFFSFGSGDKDSFYKVGVTSLLTLGIAQARHSGFFIQSALGSRGNFEVVVPRAGGGLSYFWRDNFWQGNPLGGNLDWHGPVDFAADIGHVDSASLIHNNNFGAPGLGNLELVARTGDRLVDLWHPSGTSADNWPVSAFFGSGASGNPALLQSAFGIRGRFEVVVPRADGGMLYFWRDNDPGAGYMWHGPFIFATDVGHVDGVALILSNFGTPGMGQLEVVARIGNSLAHFRRLNDEPPYSWSGAQFFAEGVSGTPAWIQGWHGRVGNYELVTPRPEGGLAHYWRNNDPGQNLTWNGPFEFAVQLGYVDSVSLIQSNYGTKGLGCLDVVARVGDRLAHLQRIDVPPYSWSDPYFFETPRGHLVLRLEPYQPPLSQPVRVTVFAEDGTTHQPVDCQVFIDSSRVGGLPRRMVGVTNRPFTYTFRLKTVGHGEDQETVYPTGSVECPIYGTSGIDFGFQ